MAVTTTTLTSPVIVTDKTIVVTSTAGFASGKLLRIDDEFLQIQQGYTGLATVPVLRGREGTVTQTHPTGANVQAGFSTDFQLQAAGGMPDSTPLPGSAPWNVTSFSATGTIPLPTAVGFNLAILNGTAALTMAVPAPTTDLDGCILIVIGNGKAAHVVNVAGTAGIGNAGAGYQRLTFAAGAQNAVYLIACNGAWVQLGLFAGTTTAIAVTLS